MVGVTPTAHPVKRNLHIMQYDNERCGVNAFGTQNADFYEKPNAATEKGYART
jgi:hypothetical protein